jgi:hypothetical protein
MRYRTPILKRPKPAEKRLGTFRFLAILPLYSNALSILLRQELKNRASLLGRPGVINGLSVVSSPFPSVASSDSSPFERRVTRSLLWCLDLYTPEAK